MLTNRVNVLASPHASDKHKFPKKNIIKDLLPSAIFNSFKIEPNETEPDHFERFFALSFVVYEQYRTVMIIIIAPVTAKGNQASGFN